MGVEGVEAASFVCEGSALEEGASLVEAMAADALAGAVGAAAGAGGAVAWNMRSARPAHEHGAAARAARKLKVRKCGDGLALPVTTERALFSPRR